MMSVKVRPMLHSDRKDVVNVIQATPDFSGEEKKVAVELLDSYLKSGESSGYHIAVAQSGFSATGYICYGPTPLTTDTWDIYWIAVASNQQGKGTGQALMEYAEHEIEKQNGRLVVIDTSSKPDYARTRRFYAEYGYEEAAVIRDFYAVGDDKVIFRKTLAEQA